MDTALATAVLERLGAPRPAPGSADLEALRRIYGAWCRRIPFDNVLKLIHCADGRGWPLPGSTTEDFFDSWLEHGTGGTCWAGNGALHDLLAACGFEVEHVIATMLPRPDIQGPNHGSVLVHVDGRRYIADASILSGEPLDVTEPGEPPTIGPYPRVQLHEGTPAILWHATMADAPFPCRLDRVGATRDEWDALHERTAAWSPFNYALSVRLLRDGVAVAFARGQRFGFAPDGGATAELLGRDERNAFLTDEIGIAPDVVAALPDDRELPPRPTG